MRSMRDSLLRRIAQSLSELDLGISQFDVDRDPVQAINRALRQVGGGQIQVLETPSLRRAANALEGAVDAVSP